MGKPSLLCNATVLEPKQVIDFVQLASLVIRVGISDNSGSKTSKPLLNEHGVVKYREQHGQLVVGMMIVFSQGMRTQG